MSPTEVHQAALQAANQAVGYWGALLMFVILGGGAWLGRYGIRKMEDLLRTLDESQKRQIEDLKASHAQLIELLSGVIIDNTKSFDGFFSESKKVVHELHELRRSIIDKCPGQRRGPDCHPMPYTSND